MLHYLMVQSNQIIPPSRVFFFFFPTGVYSNTCPRGLLYNMLTGLIKITNDYYLKSQA